MLDKLYTFTVFNDYEAKFAYILSMCTFILAAKSDVKARPS